MTTTQPTVAAPLRERSSLTTQVVGTMVVVVLLALALTTLLNALRFEETLENLVEQRLDVVAQEVASDVVVGLDLGLRIEAMDSLQAIIERLRAQVGGVAAVTVHDCDGRTIAATQAPGSVSAAVPEGVATPAGAHWRRFEPEGIALGLGITNSYGECAGGVALAYEADTFYRTRDAVVARLVWIALGAALLTLPAALLLVWVFRRRARVLKRLHADLDAMTGAGGQALPALPEPGAQDSGERELLAGYRAARPVLLETAGHAPEGATDAAAGMPSAHPGWGRRVRRWLQDPVVQALALTSATLALSLLLVSALTAQTLRTTLLPELAHKGMAESVQVARVVQRALDLEIPLAQLVGVRDYFAAVKRNDADLAFLAISDASGAILHAAGRPVEALRAVLDAPPSQEALPNPGQSLRAGYLVTRLVLKDADGAALAELRIGHDESALTRPLRESVADLAIVLVVSLLLAFEVMLLVVTLNVTLPLRATLRVLRDIAARRFALLHGEFARGEMGEIARRLDALVRRGAARLQVTPVAIRDPRLVGVRLLAFMFVFAEELARPIMPAYFGQLAAGGEGSSFIGAGMVMALHMAVVALAMPLGSVLYHRLGRRRMYMGGALLASLGLLGTGLADNLWQLLLCRALSGLGYAATFVACQGFVIEATSHANRARGSALMVGGIMLADICGPAIGGILAAWIGHRTTFMLGAGVAVLAALLVTQLMGRIADHEEDPPRITLRTFADTLGNGRFIALLLFAAVPAKLLLGGLLFYLVPLALFEFGANAAQTGRIIMLYGLVGLLCGPLFAYFTDRLQRPVLALAIGGGLTAAGAIPLMGATSDGAVALAVLALGLGQALSIPALVAAALAISQPAVARYGQGPVMAVLRLLERLGGAAGPLLAALLSTALGVTGAMAAFGAYALVSALLLLLTLRVFGRTHITRQPEMP